MDIFDFALTTCLFRMTVVLLLAAAPAINGSIYNATTRLTVLHVDHHETGKLKNSCALIVDRSQRLIILPNRRRSNTRTTPSRKSSSCVGIMAVRCRRFHLPFLFNNPLTRDYISKILPHHQTVLLYTILQTTGSIQGRLRLYRIRTSRSHIMSHLPSIRGLRLTADKVSHMCSRIMIVQQQYTLRTTMGCRARRDLLPDSTMGTTKCR